MITSIIILAFLWLGYETDWMRVRLLVGKELYGDTSEEIEQADRQLEPARKEYAEQQLVRVAKQQADNRQLVEQTGRKWQFLQYGDDCITGFRFGCRVTHCNLCRQGERWMTWKIPARTVKIYGSTINFKAGCNLYRAKLLKDIVKAQKSKALPTYKNLPETNYYKEARQSDYKSLYGEPSIELLVDGKPIASINGNYKRGTIKDALKPYTTRVGKHLCGFGEADRV